MHWLRAWSGRMGPLSLFFLRERIQLRGIDCQVEFYLATQIIHTKERLEQAVLRKEATRWVLQCGL